MGKWIIDKVIGEFDYGHNVWKQELNDELSCNSQCKCKWQHGHRGKIISYLTSNELSAADGNMVIDFNDTKIMTQFIDTFIDHKYLIDERDPLCRDLFIDFDQDNSYNFIEHIEGFKTINPDIIKNMIEYKRIKYESYVILPFTPTSENLAKWIFDIMSMKLKDTGAVVHKIEWFETPKSRATYYG